MIEIKTDPTPREIRVFGLLWLAFFGALGAVAWWRPEGLLGAASVLGLAWLVSLVFNSSERRLQLAGVTLPALFGAIGLAARSGLDPLRISVGVWAAGLLGALAVWAAPAFGRRLYIGWMVAALPVGWTISHFVLGLVYYLVLTPTGLLMRLVGRDPMKRTLEKNAKSYWIERDGRHDPKRAFRQF